MGFTGEIEYTLKNDYMFKAVFQKNEKILKGLIAALLHISFHDIRSIHIQNPIILGETVNNKDVALDLLVILNNDTRINIEMQVAPQSFWVNRSLTYMCRLHNHLEVGEEYDKVLKSIHISIIDFRLFDHEQTFYSQNRVIDINTFRVYSDNLGLNVLSLKNIEHATKEDRECGLYDWARLFVARTWEELKMVAKDNEIFQETEKAMEDLSSNWAVRLQCEMREYDRKVHEWEVKHAFKQGAEEERKRIQTEHEEMMKEQQRLKDQTAAAQKEIERLKAELAQLKSGK